MPIIGSTRPERIADAVRADAIDLDRETWYRIYHACFGDLP
jgi:predicted oxidoreductase